MKRFVLLFLMLTVFTQAATYYAQADGNIDTIEWDTVAGGGGTDLTWASLAADDILVANGHTVAINTTFTCGSIQTAATSGGFTIAGTYTINADIITGITPCLTTLAGTYTATIVGDVTGGSATNANAINKSVTAATLHITGTITGGSNVSARGIYASAAGTITVVGDVVGVTAYGISHNASNGVVDVTGDVYGSTSSTGICGLYNLSATTAMTVVGNIINRVGPAIIGPIVYNPGPTNYIQYPAPGSTTKNYYYDIPDVANVRNNDSAAGVTGELNLALYVLIADLVDPAWVVFGHNLYTGVAGEFRASDFANCTVENIKDGVTIDDVTGEYAGGGLRGGANKRGGKQ